MPSSFCFLFIFFGLFTTAQAQTFARQLNGKQGIYVLIPKDTRPIIGFGATSHVDLLDSDGSFASGHSYYYSKGGVKEVWLFILN
ncbi:MAG: hypothetical protein ABIP31_12625 [Chitinophagaceae bacterium]